MARVTIIIVAYNVEHQIGRCLDSILAQTEQDLEVLVFDNASTDNTVSAIRQYQSKSSNIILIEGKQYSKDTEVRNNAMKIAKSDYLLFVEAADQLEADHVHYTLSWAHLTGADIVMVGWREYYTQATDTEVTTDTILPYIKVGDVKEMLFRYVLLAQKGISLNPWQYLYKRDFLLKKSIYFDTSLAIHSNTAFCIKALYEANMLSYNSQSIYHHWRVAQQTPLDLYEDIKNRLATVQYVRELLSKKNELCKFQKEFNVFMLRYGYIPAVSDYIQVTDTSQRKAIGRYLKNSIRLYLSGIENTTLQQVEDTYRNKNTPSIKQLQRLHKLITKRFVWFCTYHRLLLWFKVQYS